MAKVKKGATDQTFNVLLVDSADGTPESDYTITNLTIGYVRSRAAKASNSATALSTVSDSHTDNKAIQIDKTTVIGLYRVDWPDAAFASGVDRVDLYVTGAGLHPAVLEVDLVDFNEVDLEDYLSDIYSDTVILTSDTAVIETVISDVQSDTNKIVSDLTLTSLSDLATASAVSDVKSELVIVSDTLDQVYSDTTVLETVTSDIQSDTNKIVSDLTATSISDLATASAVSDVKSELVIVSDELAKIYSDTTVLEATVSDIQSDTNRIVSDLTLTSLSDILADTATISDLTLTASDIADQVWNEATSDHLIAGSFGQLLSDIYSDTTAFSVSAADIADAVWDEKQSDHVAAGSMGKVLSDIYSDTTAFSVSAADIADAVWDEAKSDHVAAGSMGQAVSDIYSDTTVLETLVSDIQSDTNKIVSDLTLTALSDILADTATISDITITAAAVADAVWDEAKSDHVAAGSMGALLSDIYSDTDALAAGGSDWSGAQRTTILSDLAAIEGWGLSAVASDTSAIEGIVSDIQSDTNKIVSDLILSPLSDVLQDTATISNITITASAVADAVWDEKKSDHVAAGSMGQLLSDIYSDTTALAAGGSDWSGAERSTILSDLAAIEGWGLSAVASDAAALELIASDIQSDTNKIVSDLVLSPLSDILQDTATISDISITAGAVADAVWDEAKSDHVAAGSMGQLLSDIYSDTAALAAGGSDWSGAQKSTILSDLAAIEGWGLSDVASDAAAIEIESGKIYSDTTAIETVVSDVQSDTNKIVSDLTLTSISDLATASAVSDIKSELVVASDQLDKIYSDTAVVETTVSDIQSDTNKMVSDMTGTSLSDLAKPGDKMDLLDTIMEDA